MMKTHTLSLICTGLLLLAGCTRDGVDGGTPGGDEGFVTLTMGLTLPEAHAVATRSIGDLPDDDQAAADYLDALQLYIFVFEDTGAATSNYLRELVYGPKITSRHASGKQLTFSARFDGTSEKAILHIVATADPQFEEQLRSVADRSELGMMAGASGLYSAGYEAYWRRVELGQPLKQENKAAIEAMLRPVQLIRNFARVTVTQTDDETAMRGFELEGFVVVNAADHGYVAAYNEAGSAGKPEFLTAFEQPQGNTDSYYGYLSRELNYTPARHPLAGREHPDDAFGWLEGLTWDLTPKYMFERPMQDDHKTFIVVKGRFGTEERYIKLDIGTVDRSHTDPDNGGEPFGVFETFDIVRNISYDMTITKIANTDVGHTSAESAIVSPPSNNISTSIETKSMLNIYDGVDHMQVNATTVVVVDQEDENGQTIPNPATFDMKWRYYNDYLTANTLNNSTVRWNFPGYAFEFDAEGNPKGAGDTSGIIRSSNALQTFRADDTDRNPDDWQGFSLTFNTPDDIVRQKTVRLYSPFGLTRDVTFVMRKRWEFVNNSPEKYPNAVEVYPGFYSYEQNGVMPFDTMDEMREYIEPGEVGSQRGAQLTVMFELPNDIPQALFPLDFTIGFDRQNVENAYVGNAAVIYGPSMFEEDHIDVPRMQFVKTVDWSYYNGTGDPGDYGHKIVTARFLTTTDVLGSNESDNDTGETSTTRVRVKNPYFILGQDSFLRNTKDSNVDPDPNRTLWSWYFGDPGWATYFTVQNTGHTADKYNELWFDTHTANTRDGYALQMTPGHSATSPEFRIDFDTTTNALLTAGNYTATLQFTGAPLYYSVGTNSYYRRRPYAQATVRLADGSTTIRDFPQFDAFDRSVPRSGNGLFEGKPSVVEQSFTINPGETIESIVIWSDRLGSNDETSGDRVATLWYGIRCEITPN